MGHIKFQSVYERVAGVNRLRITDLDRPASQVLRICWLIVHYIYIRVYICIKWTLSEFSQFFLYMYLYTYITILILKPMKCVGA